MLFILLMIIYLVGYAGFVALRPRGQASVGRSPDSLERSGAAQTPAQALPLAGDTVGNPVWTALDEHQLTRLLRQSAP